MKSSNPSLYIHVLLSLFVKIAIVVIIKIIAKVTKKNTDRPLVIQAKF